MEKWLKTMVPEELVASPWILIHLISNPRYVVHFLPCILCFSPFAPSLPAYFKINLFHQFDIFLALLMELLLLAFCWYPLYSPLHHFRSVPGVLHIAHGVQEVAGTAAGRAGTALGGHLAWNAVQTRAVSINRFCPGMESRVRRKGKARMKNNPAGLGASMALYLTAWSH